MISKIEINGIPITVTTTSSSKTTKVEEHQQQTAAATETAMIIITKTTTTSSSENEPQSQLPETNGTAFVTPPATPRNESQQQPSIHSEHPRHEIKLITGQRIILNTPKEPPIVFLSDFETDNKLTQAKKKIEVTPNTESPVEVAISTLKKGEEVNAPIQSKVLTNFHCFV